MSGSDTIYHGDFYLNKYIDSEDITDPFDFLTISGRYVNGELDDTWKIKSGQFEGNGDLSYGDHRLKINVTGSEFFANAKFAKGLKSGEWQVFEWRVENAEVVDTLLNAQITFKNNLIDGKLRFEDKKHELNGQVGKNELATGTWSYYKKVGNNRVLTEEWVFEKDQLSQKVRYEGDKKYHYRTTKFENAVNQLL